MKNLLRVLLLAGLVSAPGLARAGDAESSLDDVDRGAADSLDEARQGDSIAPDDAPQADAAAPKVVGPGAEVTDQGESLDRVDTGRSETPTPDR